MQVNLEGRSAVVTGAGTGIGQSTAVMLAEAGASVTIVGRRKERLDETRTLVEAVGGRVLVAAADAADETAVDAVFRAHEGHFGGLDILINNAAITGPTARVGDISLEDWNESLRINLTGPFLCTRRALPLLRASGHGRIVTIGSLSAHFPRFGRSPYTATKAALLGFNRTLALEEGPNGVLANYVCPGTIDGERIRGVMSERARAKGTTPEAELAERTSATPIGRILQPEEIASLCVFLASDLASGITGEVFNVSGGRHA